MNNNFYIKFNEDTTEFNGEHYENLNVNQLCKTDSDIFISNILYEHSQKPNYCYRGKWSRFLGKSNDDFAYKVFINPSTKEGIENIFNMQNILFKAGYSSKPYEILEFNSDNSSYYAIKMESIKGTHVTPDLDWIDKFCTFCSDNNMVRDDSDHNQRYDIKGDCNISNCIQTEDKSKIYMIDIDWKWKINK